MLGGQGRWEHNTNLELYSASFSEVHETHEYKRSSSLVVPKFPNVEDKVAPVAYSILGPGGIATVFPKLLKNVEEFT